jgi:putative membrane-bound dehydrogenase-like protein
MNLPRLLAALSALTLVSRASEFPEPKNSETDLNKPLLPAAEAAAKMTLPPGMKATVFAAEPDVQNPIALAWDARGRLWVAENYTYAERSVRYDLSLRDRIVIFEDADGDGRFDARKVFADDLQMLTSLEVGLGGVWAITMPHVVFIPDRDSDDRPDGLAEAVIEGFHAPQQNHHNIANGLRFGPDGWLYGRCGASGPADVKVVGGSGDAIPVRGGMWRYHPRTRAFEAITCGNTNPWGHDWNEHGELFYTNTVNGHLWHAVAGAHFVRAHTLDPNPRAYSLIDQCADHWHFDTSQDWSKSRDGVANALGGGHSHIGAMVYLGDNWPAEFRGKLLTLNQHGRRANVESLERQGSGYVGRHGEDTLLSADAWFRGIDLTYGPDGGVYVLDWSDTGECHDNTGVHRTSGRIFKITHGEPKKPAVGDLRKLSSRELVARHTHANEWFARQARLELAARAASGRGLDAAKDWLRELFEKNDDVVVKLRALWSLHGIGAADTAFLTAQLDHQNEHVRTWAVRLLTDAWPLDTLTSGRPAIEPGAEAAHRIVPELVKVAHDDRSGLVRLALASAVQRLPIADRVALAGELAARRDDADDDYLPLLLWYGLIPVADADLDALVTLARRCELPIVRQSIARRLAEDIEKDGGPLNDLLTQTKALDDVTTGIAEAMTGWRKAPKPAVWDTLVAKLEHSPDTALVARVRDLSVVFGDGRALDDVKKIALDGKADLGARKAALQTLIESRAPGLREMCDKLLDTRFLNSVAVRGLATFDDPSVGARIVKARDKFHPSERAQWLAALVSRPAFAATLLDAVAAGRVPRTDISAFDARQIRSFNDPALTKRLAEVWGEDRESSADKKAQIAKWKAVLTPAAIASADKSAGRATFTTACATCHTLYGEGGKLGPDLTGSGRDNLDYLLENIVDPSATVSADFRMTVLHLKDGRVFNGMISAKSDRTVALQTMSEKLTLERGDIAKTDELPMSLMPEGLPDALGEAQMRNLIAYLMHRTQVPLAGAK